MITRSALGGRSARPDHLVRWAFSLGFDVLEQTKNIWLCSGVFLQTLGFSSFSATAGRRSRSFLDVALGRLTETYSRTVDTDHD